MGYNHYSQTFAKNESRCKKINVTLNLFQGLSYEMLKQVQHDTTGL